MYCKHCGAPLASGDESCPVCGQKNLIFREGNGFWDILEEKESHPRARCPTIQQTTEKKIPQAVHNMNCPPKCRENAPKPDQLTSPAKRRLDSKTSAVLRKNKQPAPLNRMLLIVSLILMASVLALTIALILCLRGRSDHPEPVDLPSQGINTETLSPENGTLPMPTESVETSGHIPEESAGAQNTTAAPETRESHSIQDVLPHELLQDETTVPDLSGSPLE